MPVTFEVDEVVPAQHAAATIRLRQLVGEHAYLGIDPELGVLDDHTMHPLIGAVHHAFVDHRPLVLSPDAVWLTIAQGVAQHVRLNAEALRPRLVAHAGKQTLNITLGAPPASAADWGAAITTLRHALAGAIGEGRARLLTCDFSTTGDAERIASEVVLMDVMSAYYDFSISIVCGIPRITLLGTPEDWKQLRARIDVIAELDLTEWAGSLVHIADELVAAANGTPDVAFFQGIYKPHKAYGWDIISGWIARLYPYVQSRAGDYTRANPLLAVPFDHEEPERDGYYNGPGIRSCDAPAGASRVLVRMNNGNRTDIATVEGGLLAVEQTTDGELVPRAGFLVRLDHGAASVIERLRAEHGATTGHESAGATWHHAAELRALFEAIDSCTIQLGDSAWTLLPPAQRTAILVARETYRAVIAVRVLDLGDGTLLAIAGNGHVIRLRSERLAPTPPREAVTEPDAIEVWHDADACELLTDERMEAIPVVATSFIVFLARMLREGIDLRSTTTLFDLEPDWWDTSYHAAPLLDRLRRQGKLVDADDEGDSFFGALSMTVGSATWRRFEPPAEWRHGPRRAIQIADVQAWAEPLVDLGDGTLLARVRSYPHTCIVRISRIPIVATPARKKAVHIESSQPAAEIPVLGRSLVDVLAFAIEHDQLPRPLETLADFQSRASR